MDRIIPEDVMPEQVKIPDGHDLYYVKLVGIGPKTLANKSGNPAEVSKGVKGHYFIAPTDDIEEMLVGIIRRCFANRREQQNGTAKDGQE